MIWGTIIIPHTTYRGTLDLQPKSAIAVANWLIENRGEHDITNMKLQKLLYVAFAYHIAKHNQAIFYDPIEAWKYGPVIQSVYLWCRHHGAGAIKSPIEFIDGEIPRLEPAEDSSIIESLALILSKYGSMTASQLMHWSHSAGGPWDRTYHAEGHIREIPPTRIRDYYRETLWPEGRKSVSIA